MMTPTNRGDRPAHAGVPVRISEVRLGPDPLRTVLRPFLPGEPSAPFAHAEPRTGRIVERALFLKGAALEAELARLTEPLVDRHRGLTDLLLSRFEEVAADLPVARRANEAQRLLIGAYFTQQFAFESTALFNPSVVRHPEQTGMGKGDVRIVLSLRGIGEGHVSTLAFRTGIWRADGSVDVDPASRFAVGPTVVETDLPNGRTSYHLTYQGARDLSEQVVYPFLPIQGRGIEDVRLVEFIDDDGASTYRGTFTAFNGSDVRQAMLRTDDFAEFDMRGVEGDLYAGKGMALFPRRIGGRYAMLSRHDNENVWLTFSDDVHQWNGGEILLRPEQPWESIQMGNCGSPMEIDEGFLVLTHGVGGIRGYSIGAVLLDKRDPSRVLGRMAEPLLSPGAEHDGYVPNVVYSCGGMVRGRELLLPFAVADTYVRFAVLRVDDLIAAMS